MPGDPFNVRVFGYRVAALRRQFMREEMAVFVPEEPPVWSVASVSNGVEPVEVSFPGVGPDNAQMIGIEVPEGHAIRYELQPFGPAGKQARKPGNASRRMGTGLAFMEWSEGSSFSFVDAVDLP